MRGSTPWKVRLSYSALANNPGGEDYLNIPRRTLLKKRVLAKGLGCGVNCYLLSSGLGVEGERGTQRLGGSKLLAQCDFFKGKVSDLAHIVA